MPKKVALYAHGGSGNHGCEAIVRSLVKKLSLSTDTILLSDKPEEDLKYGLDELVRIEKSATSIRKGFLYSIRAKLSGNPNKYYYKKLYRNLPSLVKGCDVAYSIGGDNYCYSGMDLEMMIMRQLIEKAGVPTILMGCSVEPEKLSREILDDMRKYKEIWCRESLTYEALKKYGFENLRLESDSAFVLNRKDNPLTEGFIEGNTVGINLSPLVIKNEIIPGIVMRNYERLIEFIINTSNMNVALIPHVVWPDNDDREPLRELYDKYKSSGRICMIEDQTCEEIKGYIARCKYMVAARTHASIAAYSTGVPTLVVGYSVKARGIAKDLFGTYENYVFPVQEMKQEIDLKDRFTWLLNNRTIVQ